METVVKILNQLASESSTTGKKEILKKNGSNELLKSVLKYALDQGRTYNVTELNFDTPPAVGVTGPVVFSYLDFLSSKKGATDKQANELSALANRCEYTQVVVTKIIQKDLKCGVGAKLVNSVFKDLIYTVPYQRYKSFKFIEKIDFEKEVVVVQLKMDGMFSYLFPDGEMVTRNGSKFNLQGTFDGALNSGWLKRCSELLGEPLVWMGEVLVKGLDGKYLPRKEGNGIINSFISGDGDESRRKDIEFVTWGYVTLADYKKRESDMPYTKVLNLIEAVIPPEDSNVKFSQSKSVETMDEALEYYREVRERKEEGSMVKVASKLTWRDQQSGTPHGVKLKPEAIAEFEIVDAYYGDKKGKRAELLGGIIIKSLDGKIFCKCGGGFNDEEIALGVDWWKDQVGKIVSVKYTGITTDKSNRKTYCLEHSRMAETRFSEKDEADTYEYCVEELEKV